MPEEKPTKEEILENKVAELKKKLAVARRKTTNAETTAERWKRAFEKLKDFHEGPNREGQHKERYAEERAKENIARKWPELARALALYIDPESYTKMRDSLPQPGFPYSAGKQADTAYNKFIDLLNTELHELGKTVAHKYRK